MDNSYINNLVAKAGTGDEQAFGLLYDEYADRLYKYICFKITDSEEAEQLLQEVFIKVWQGCAKLEQKNLNFTSWIYTIAHNTINDYFRRVYRRPQTTPLEPNLDIVATDDTSQTTSDNFRSSNIQKALANLPGNYKQVLELRFLQELSVEETAKVLKKNSIAVRVLQHRAIKQLQKIFSSL